MNFLGLHICPEEIAALIAILTGWKWVAVWIKSHCFHPTEHKH